MSWDPPSSLPPPSGSGPVGSSTPEELRDTGRSAPPADVPPPIIRTPRTFISYRRKQLFIVERLDARLREDLGTTNVYRDVKDLIVGEDFEDRVFEEIDRSDAVIVVVGPGWEAGASSRLDEPHDFVRREVAAALASDTCSTPLPVLLDGATFPEPLPTELRDILRMHRLETGSDELLAPDSESYQGLLVGVWESKRRRTPNGILVFGGESTVACAAIDGLVSEMKRRRLVDTVELTRYACNARVLTRRAARRLSKKYHDVIVVVDPESAQSPVLLARLRELGRRRDVKVAVLAVGGTLMLSGGVIVGEGGLKGLPGELAEVLHELGPTKLANKASQLVSWRATASVSTKVALAGAGVAVAGGAAFTIDRLTDEPSIALAGDWRVGDFTVSQEGTDGTFRPIPGGSMSFESVDPGCDGRHCDVVVTEGPDFLIGARMSPDGEGGYSTVFAVDETQTIRRISGGVTCRSTSRDLTPVSTLDFEAGVDEVTDQLRFSIIVRIPESECTAGSVDWSADARRVAGD